MQWRDTLIPSATVCFIRVQVFLRGQPHNPTYTNLHYQSTTMRSGSRSWLLLMALLVALLLLAGGSTVDGKKKQGGKKKKGGKKKAKKTKSRKMGEAACTHARDADR